MFWILLKLSPNCLALIAIYISISTRQIMKHIVKFNKMITLIVGEYSYSGVWSRIFSYKCFDWVKRLDRNYIPCEYINSDQTCRNAMPPLALITLILRSLRIFLQFLCSFNIIRDYWRYTQTFLPLDDKIMINNR